MIFHDMKDTILDTAFCKNCIGHRVERKGHLAGHGMVKVFWKWTKEGLQP
jgi:hypothetical protein